MNSRERVLAAINHKQPDRVPMDLGSTPSSGISAIAYGNLKKHLDMRGGHTRVYDVCQQVAQPEDMLLDHYNIDVVDVGRRFNTDDESWYDVRLEDGQVAQYPAWFHPKKQADGSWVGHKNGKDLNLMPAGGGRFSTKPIFLT